MNDSLVAFYPAAPFWAGNKLSISDQSIPEDLPDQMAECMFCSQTEEWALYICRDGMFVLIVYSLEEPASSREKYLNYINCILLLLESALYKVTGNNWIFSEEITKKNVLEVWNDNNHFQVSSLPSYGVAELFSEARHLKTASYGDISWYWLHDRPVIEQAVFDTLFIDMSLVMNNSQHVGVLSRVMKSLSEYRMADKEVSLVIAWFIIESFLMEKWSKWLDSKNKTYEDKKRRLNKERLKNLEGRDYTASIVTNILELVDMLPFDQFETLNYLRKIRNDVVHSTDNAACMAEDCQKALNLVTALIEEKMGLTLKIDLSHPIY